MEWQAWYTLGVVALVVISLVRNLGPPDAVLLGATLLVALAGVITPEEAFAGFTNPGVLTIGALFVIAAAMRETGALDTVSRWIFGRARNERQALVRMALPVAGMSAFLNNTPIVAMLGPVVIEWCRKNSVSPSRLLMPLSYMAILGGACTLIGTSTNLVIDGLMRDARVATPALEISLRPMGLFELAYVGVPYVVIGLLYVVFVSGRLLPNRKNLIERLDAAPREYMVNMVVETGCRLVGQTVEEAGLRHLPGLFLVEVYREEKIIAPVGPTQILHENDILTFSGVVGTIVDLERIQGLVPVADEGYEVRAAARRNKMMCEAVVSGTSPLVGKSIRDADFRAVYNAAVIAVHRGAERIEGRIGDIVLRSGDTLLLQAGPGFARGQRNSRDFYLVSDVEDSRPVRHDKAVIAVVLLILLLGILLSGTLSTVLAAYLVAALMVATRCIYTSVARRTIDWQTLLTIGAAFGLGKALHNSGCAEVLAGFVAEGVGQWGPHAVLFATYVITSIFTETVTNKAAAVLMFPIALSVALQIDVDPRPFIMATTIATAATFASPLGYPTNLMVYGPGGYRFLDFVRVGLPLNVVLTGVGVFIIPLVWPF